MSGGPLPAYSFTIPSIHDATPIDCRIYLPASLETNDKGAGSVLLPSKKAAVVAHPYAPLGGSMDDPVVLIVVDQLLAQDIIVGSFNFRGAANSKGTTSWIGRAERDDYISVAGHMIFYIRQLEMPPSNPIIPEKPSDEPAETGRPDSLESISLILGGYSYGSLILTELPPTPDIMQLFLEKQAGESIKGILLRAATLATQTNEQLVELSEERGRPGELNKAHQGGHRKSNSHGSIVYGGSETPTSAGKAGSHDGGRGTDFIHKSIELPGRLKQVIRHGSTRSLIGRSSSRSVTPKSSIQSLGTKPEIKNLPHVFTSYLLISPLLPPLSLFLSLSRMSGLMSWRQASNTDILIRNPTLAVFGTTDMFTSSNKLEAWGKKMEALSMRTTVTNASSSFRWRSVEGAGHFWKERGVETELRGAIREWAGSSSMP